MLIRRRRTFLGALLGEGSDVIGSFPTVPHVDTDGTDAADASDFGASSPFGGASPPTTQQPILC